MKIRTNGLPRRLDAAIDLAISQDRIVGASVVVARHGERIYERAAGDADREAGRKATVDTLFRLASLTKALVGVTALTQIQRGILALDGPVTDWLPQFTPRLADGRTPTITIRHLLSHTAGLSYGFNQPRRGPYATAGVSDGLAELHLTLEENLERIAGVPLSYEPGKGWAYSVATDVLGGIVARAHGDTLDAAVRHCVTGPLGMTATTFTAPARHELAAPYANGAGKPRRMGEVHYFPTSEVTGIRFMPDRVFHPGVWQSGGSGMVGTAPEFLIFLEALRTGRILYRPTLAAAIVDQAGAVPMPFWNLGRGHGLFAALLLDPAAAASGQPPGTWSWSGLYGNAWFVDPVNEISVVSCSNTALEGCIGQFPTDIAKALYDGADT